MDARLDDAVRGPVERLRDDEAGLERSVDDARRQAASVVEAARREAEAIASEARREAEREATWLRDETAAQVDALEADGRAAIDREVAELAQRAAAHRDEALAWVVRRVLGEDP